LVPSGVSDSSPKEPSRAISDDSCSKRGFVPVTPNTRYGEIIQSDTESDTRTIHEESGSIKCQRKPSHLSTEEDLEEENPLLNRLKAEIPSFYTNEFLEELTRKDSARIIKPFFLDNIL